MFVNSYALASTKEHHELSEWKQSNNICYLLLTKSLNTHLLINCHKT